MSEYMADYGRSYALVLGINEYAHMPPLTAAVRGARETARVLQQTYGFQTTLLTNSEVTSNAFYTWIYDLAGVSQPDDRVIIYFAGHGATRVLGGFDRGYLVLSDSEPKRWNTMVEMDRVFDEAKDFKAKHLAYLLDCCFGGLVFQQRSDSAAIQRDVTYALARRVRYAISAGSEPVDDSMAPGGEYSLFTYHMLDYLKRDYDPDGVWSANELGYYIRERVGRNRRVEQMPVYGPLSGAGDFIFKWETGPRFSPELTAALASSSTSLRLGAVAELIEIARSESHELRDEARQLLADISTNDPEETIRSTASSLFEEEAAIRAAEEGHILWQQAKDRVEEAERRRSEALARVNQADEEERRLNDELRHSEESVEQRLKRLEEMRRKAEAENQRIQNLAEQEGRKFPWWLVAVAGAAIVVVILSIATRIPAALYQQAAGTPPFSPDTTEAAAEYPSLDSTDSPSPEPAAEESTPTNAGPIEWTAGNLLFDDDFEDGDLIGWAFDLESDAWSVIDDGSGNRVLQGVNIHEPAEEINEEIATTASSWWTNYVLEFRVRAVGFGNPPWDYVFTVFTRHDTCRYEWTLNLDYTVLNRGWGACDYIVLRDAGLEYPLDRWETIRVEAENNVIRGYMHDVLVISKTVDQTSNLPQGGIGFWVPPTNTIWFDDIKVTEWVPAN